MEGNKVHASQIHFILFDWRGRECVEMGNFIRKEKFPCFGKPILADERMACNRERQEECKLASMDLWRTHQVTSCEDLLRCNDTLRMMRGRVARRSSLKYAKSGCWFWPLDLGSVFSTHQNIYAPGICMKWKMAWRLLPSFEVSPKGRGDYLYSHHLLSWKCTPVLLCRSLLYTTV